MIPQPALGPLDRIARDRKHHKVTPLTYKTPGHECQHATNGACPHCTGEVIGYMRSLLADNTHAGRI